jgi:hypothetical protein
MAVSIFVAMRLVYGLSTKRRTTLKQKVEVAAATERFRDGFAATGQAAW